MALADIRKYVGQKVGVDITSDTKAIKLVDYTINRAAFEIYKEKDPAGCLLETFVQVMPDSTIALPQFIGPLRGVREHFSPSSNDNLQTFPWQLMLLQPRYINDIWERRWNKFIFRSFSPLQTNVINAGPLTFEIAIPDNSTVTVTGTTISANNITDTVTMSNTSNTGALSFISITSINRRDTNNCNIVIKDVNGTKLAILYNNYTETKYRLFDVSKFPAIGSNNSGPRCLEILYKKPLTQMTNDGDVYILPEYDTIIGMKAVQLWVEDRPGQEERALTMDKRITREMNREEGDIVNNVKAQMNFAEESLFDIRGDLSWGGDYYNDYRNR